MFNFEIIIPLKWISDHQLLLLLIRFQCIANCSICRTNKWTICNCIPCFCTIVECCGIAVHSILSHQRTRLSFEAHKRDIRDIHLAQRLKCGMCLCVESIFVRVYTVYAYTFLWCFVCLGGLRSLSHPLFVYSMLCALCSLCYLHCVWVWYGILSTFDLHYAIVTRDPTNDHQFFIDLRSDQTCKLHRSTEFRITNQFRFECFFECVFLLSVLSFDFVHCCFIAEIINCVYNFVIVWITRANLARVLIYDISLGLCVVLIQFIL